MATERTIVNGSRGYFIIYDIVIALVAIVANSIVMRALTKSQFSPQSYRKLVINLASCDLFACIVNFSAIFYHFLWSMGDDDHPVVGHRLFPCGATVLRSLQLASFFAHLFNLCSMSIDHFLGVQYPTKYRLEISLKMAKCFIAATWLISFMLAFADLLVALVIFMDNGNESEQIMELGDNSQYYNRK